MPEHDARVMFCPYLIGDAGVTVKSLCQCLAKCGWMLSQRDDLDATYERFDPNFEEQAILFYIQPGATISHAVLVCPGGVVLDPFPDQAEEGEPIATYFERVGQLGQVTIKYISTVTRMN